MMLILLALACSSVIPESTSNPVDKLAGYADVRLGQKVGDIPGLVREPKDDNYTEKEEAYTRPADRADFMMGSSYISANGPPTYAVRDGVLFSVTLKVKDVPVVSFPGDGSKPVFDVNPSLNDCGTLLEALTKLLGSPAEDGEAQFLHYTWSGDLSRIRVGTYTNTYDGTRTCFYSTRMSKDSQ